MLGSQPSVADDLKTECPEPAFPNRCYVVGMSPGDKAPIAGDLLSVEMAIKMAQSAANVEERIKIEVAKTSSTAKADRERDQKVHEAEPEAKDDRISFLEDAAERSADRSIFQHPAAWFLYGVGITVLIVAIVEHRPQPSDG